MKEYKVLRREVHVSVVRVNAENPTEAVQKVADGEGDEYATEYSETMATDTWSVEAGADTYYHNEATGKFDKKNNPSRG